MILNFTFVDSSGNDTYNWEIFALVGAKGMVADVSAVGGAEGTEVVAGRGRGDCRAETKGAFLFYSSQMTDMTWERLDLVFKARLNCFLHPSLEGFPSVLFRFLFVSIRCFFTKYLPAAKLCQLVNSSFWASDNSQNSCQVCHRKSTLVYPRQDKVT